MDHSSFLRLYVFFFFKSRCFLHSGEWRKIKIVQKCSFYLRGLPLFNIYIDHRPLEGVFQKDLFDFASPRLQRMQEKVAMYSFKVTWVASKTHLIGDALSPAPLLWLQEQPGLEVDTAIMFLARTSQPSLNIIYDAVDEDYRALIEDVLHGTSSLNLLLFSQDNSD